MTAQGSGSNPSTDLARHQSLWGKALQWTLIALLVSTAFLTGDGPAVAQGMSSWLIMCYLLVGCAWGIYQWLFPTVGFYRQWPTFLLLLDPFDAQLLVQPFVLELMDGRTHAAPA